MDHFSVQDKQNLLALSRLELRGGGITYLLTWINFLFLRFNTAHINYSQARLFFLAFFHLFFLLGL